VNVATGWHIHFKNLVTCDLVVNLQYSSMENGNIPVFYWATNQKESDVVFNFWKNYLVKSLYLVKAYWCLFSWEKIVINISLVFFSRVNAVVVVVFSKYIHALPYILKVFACSKYFIEKICRILYNLLQESEYLTKVGVSLC